MFPGKSGTSILAPRAARAVLPDSPRLQRDHGWTEIQLA
jgi:hypothetical protein